LKGLSLQKKQKSHFTVSVHLSIKNDDATKTSVPKTEKAKDQQQRQVKRRQSRRPTLQVQSWGNSPDREGGKGVPPKQKKPVAEKDDCPQPPTITPQTTLAWGSPNREKGHRRGFTLCAKKRSEPKRNVSPRRETRGERVRKQPQESKSEKTLRNRPPPPPKNQKRSVNQGPSKEI